MTFADRIPAYLERTEQALERALPDSSRSPRKLHEAMRYSVLGGGKRLRPLLVYATGEAFAVQPDRLDAPAVAIELMHAFSLIHDDLPAMDDDDLRRGRPTSHVAHGEDVAILAGDALFAEAIRLACQQRGDPARVLAAVREIAAATGVDGMVGGQYVDVIGGGRDPDSLRMLHSLKTGRLIAVSVGAALALAGRGAEVEAPYRRFATELGLLFQIVDDILDVIGSEAELGKPSGSDERHGKLTYVSLFGLDRARDLAAESYEKAARSLDDAGGEVEDLRRIATFIATRTS